MKRRFSDAKERPNPQISLNKLGEYVAASTPSRRRRIVTDAKFPDYKPALHEQGRHAILDLLRTGELDPFPIETLLKELEKSRGPRISKQLENAIRDLRNFHQSAPQLAHLTGLTEIRSCIPENKLLFEGVQVSIRPDLIFSLPCGKQGNCIGAVKLWMSSTIHMEEDAGKSIAALMYHHLSQNQSFLPALKLKPQLVMAFDIHTGLLVSSTGATTKALADARAACQEIAARWPTIQKPAARPEKAA